MQKFGPDRPHRLPPPRNRGRQRPAPGPVSQVGHGVDLPEDGHSGPAHRRRRARPPPTWPSWPRKSSSASTTSTAIRSIFSCFARSRPTILLPTTACLLQDRLKLPTSIGALDFNLGCSGFVYGLSLADGLIRSGAARRILLITAETYSKYIHPTDRSLRTIFGDGAAATLIEAADEPSLGGFVFGTDGRGADTLMVAEGGARPVGRRLEAPQAQALAQRPGDGRSGDRQVHAGGRAADDRAGARSGEVDPRRRRVLPHAPGHVLHAGASPRAAGSGGRADAVGLAGIRQHGLFDPAAC